MKILKKLFREKNPSTDKGLLIFDNTSEVIRAENILKSHGFNVKVVGPPPHVRKGCDLAIEFPIVETMGVLNVLETKGLSPIDCLPSNDGNLKPVDLFHIKDYGRFLMVRAANMKITIHKSSLTIVNISGGGCPDVPYLAACLVGKKINEAPEPRTLGHTLCGYALQLAYDKIKELCWQ
ncbi:MAG: DUF3343 domain-containing protein [Thermodesulfovibrio sp.]|jgi:hypothetical protein|uniref:DUF3343 domain-containing protein n=1 Tax=unclassified Thermodesulfovibrio TaxID=2645936 RepID=UPI00083A4640|nr:MULTISPECIES: DUF3343 domain-containing protein [unclassified Thermodesulfovibrio]MDI1472060.1 DUF3343 domain-containing protein [Thermodesulfovibrio sp. 1176]MDI6713748.1 DUF3343 domain-containing protein [Thermodesulfovibrio sp.]ODA45182.1 hypothetical protein THER_0057 [Thermodesulfovibrio sp. N1]